MATLTLCLFEVKRQGIEKLLSLLTETEGTLATVIPFSVEEEIPCVEKFEDTEILCSHLFDTFCLHLS